jgi:hypothetical protein
MRLHSNVIVRIEEMISVIQTEAINLKNAGEIHRAHVLKETAEFLTKQKRNGFKNN